MPVETQTCPCGSGLAYADCCGPLHSGQAQAETAEALMRSRYSAYALGYFDYLVDSLHPKQRKPGLAQELNTHGQDFHWLELEILNTANGGPQDKVGKVEFKAWYRRRDQPKTVNRRCLHEVSRFKKYAQRWYYWDGVIR